MEVSVVSEIAARGGLSYVKRLTSSAAMCWASAADPPLPNINTLPPDLIDSIISAAAAATFSACESKNARLVSRLRRASS
jgi:hypothetical protein